MSLTSLTGKISTIAKRSLHTTSFNLRGPVSYPGWYPRDHRPGNYPENDEERRAAAIKYGLRPEDYQPIDKDDVRNFRGDYPELGCVTIDHRDPYEPYSDRTWVRNWGEPMQIDWMRFRPDRITYTGLDEEPLQFWNSLNLLAKMAAPIALFIWYIQSCERDPNPFVYKNPMLQKQFPYDYVRAFPFSDPQMYPLLNYSFEPADGVEESVHSTGTTVAEVEEGAVTAAGEADESAEGNDEPIAEAV